MNSNYKNFGEFLNKHRLDKGVSYRELSKVLGVSAPYISDVEKDRRNAFPMEKLQLLASYFVLNDDEKAQMYDLAGEKKSTLAPDLPEYILNHNIVAVALRTARDLGASENDWEKFVEDLKKRKG